MKTPEQLKGTIRSMAAKRNLRAQEVLQMFLFERILERLANSKYKMNFILKGGLLISSMIGISERTTMDMDTTVRGIQMEEDDIVRIVKEILTVDVDDGILFEYESIEPIREEDAYNNFRVHLRAKYGKIDTPMKIDVTAGDAITPAAVQYDFPMLFEMCIRDSAETAGAEGQLPHRGHSALRASAGNGAGACGTGRGYPSRRR